VLIYAVVDAAVESGTTMNNERSAKVSVDSSANNGRRAKVPSAVSVNCDRCDSVTATAE